MKRIVISALVVLLVVTIVGSFTLAMGKEVAVDQKQPEVKKVQTETKKITETQAIEPKLVMEYKFDEPIADVIFDEAEMTVKEARDLGMRGLEQKKETEKVKISYPKVVLTREIPEPGYEAEVKSLIFLNKDGKVKKQIDVSPKSLTSPIISQKYIGVSKSSPYNLYTKERGPTQFYLFDTNGNQILEKKFDGSRGFLIANNGNFASFESDEGSGDYLFFYDSTGNLLKKVMPFKMGGYFSARGVYSKSGKYIVMSFVYPGVIILFDYEGNEIWRKKLIEGISADQLVFSLDEKYIYTSGLFYSKEDNRVIEYAYLFDINGNELPKDLKEKLLFEQEDQKKRFEKDGFLYLIKENKIQVLKTHNNKNG